MGDEAQKVAKKPLKKLVAKEQDVSPTGIVTPSITAAVDDRFKSLEKGQKNLNDFMYFMVVVLFIGFAAALTSYFLFVKDSFTEYSNVVRQFNDQKYQMLENRIKELESKSEVSITPIPKPT